MISLLKTSDDRSAKVIEASDPDLNRLLFEEQSAIMRAEAAGDSILRHAHEDEARDVRSLIDETEFPKRAAHDFEARRRVRGREQDVSHRSTSLSGDARAECTDADLALLQAHCLRMELELSDLVASGRIGRHHNTYEHRSRIVRQQRQRIRALCDDGPSDDLNAT
ncbi:hypothetical protein FHS96_003107 [Sphingomonas zeicaulis]|uniref:hypothetical protein n=1 Tax=Sphingomonas zeicaulis TaxID=1632740 RepID=UPI003D22B48D